MKNKDKYNLSTLDFKWIYNSYHDRLEISIFSEEEYITYITCEGYSPIPAIMEWLEQEEEND